MADERKIREIYGVKSVLDEAAERIEATWREKLLRETADLRSENALLRVQLDEFNRKLGEPRAREQRAPRRERQISHRCQGARQAGRPAPR